MVAGATAAWDSRFQGGGVAPHLQSSARIQTCLHPNVAFCATVSGIVALSWIISLSRSMTTALITQTVQPNCLLLRDNSRQVTPSWGGRLGIWSARTKRETYLQAARAGGSCEFSCGHGERPHVARAYAISRRCVVITSTRRPISTDLDYSANSCLKSLLCPSRSACVPDATQRPSCITKIQSQ